MFAVFNDLHRRYDYLPEVRRFLLAMLLIVPPQCFWSIDRPIISLGICAWYLLLALTRLRFLATTNKE